LRSTERRNREDDPASKGGNHKETKKSYPDGCQLVEPAHKNICIAECEQGSGDEGYGQDPESQLEPHWPGHVRARQKGPGLIEQQMSQKENRLQGQNEKD